MSDPRDPRARRVQVLGAQPDAPGGTRYNVGGWSTLPQDDEPDEMPDPDGWVLPDGRGWE